MRRADSQGSAADAAAAATHASTSLTRYLRRAIWLPMLPLLALAIGLAVADVLRQRDADDRTATRLAGRSGETASFYVREGERDTCLFRVESTRAIRDAGVAEGDSFPVDGSAGSRVLSAHLGGARGQAAALTGRLGGDAAVFRGAASAAA